MINNFMRLIQLDSQLRQYRSLLKFSKTKKSWVKSIRQALGMTIEQLASRLKVSTTRVKDIENAEVIGAITLKSMEDVAEKLHCKFVYALVPQEDLISLINNRVEAKLNKQQKRVHHTMNLESQSVSEQMDTILQDQMKKALLEKSWKHLWEDDE